MNPRIELTGTQAGDWRVLRHTDDHRAGTHYICRCVHCHSSKIIRGDNLRSGKATKHRGCPGPAYVAVLNPQAQEFAVTGRTTVMAEFMNAGAANYEL